MRRTVAALRFTAAALVRVDQCVALAGFSSVVLSTTCCTVAAGMRGVRPARGASFSNPAMPRSRNRLRQRAALCAVTFNAAALSWSSFPAAASHTMRAPSTWRPERERALAHCSSTSFCSGLSTTRRATPMRRTYLLSRRCSLDTDYYLGRTTLETVRTTLDRLLRQ